MKKFLSIPATFLILGALATSSFATDTTSLTKATVKLIKENRVVNQEIININENLKNIEKKIEQDRAQIKFLKDEHASLMKAHKQVEGKNELDALTKRIAKLEKNTKENRKLVERIAAVEKLYDSKAKSATELGAQAGALGMQSTIKYEKLVERLESVEKLYEDLKQKLDNQKIKYDAKIQSLKDEIKSNGSKTCKIGNCTADSDSEDIIKNFIK